MGYRICYGCEKKSSLSFSFVRTQVGICGLLLLGLYCLRVCWPEGHLILRECLKGDGTGAEAVINLIGELSSGADPIRSIAAFCHEIAG